MKLDGETYIKYNDSMKDQTSDWVTYDEFCTDGGLTFVGAYR